LDSAAGGVDEGADEDEDEEPAGGVEDEPAEDGLLALPEALPEALPDDGGVLGVAEELLLPDLGADDDLDASLPQAASANAAATATRSALVIRLFLCA
jgi:hypothetical protein